MARSEVDTNDLAVTLDRYQELLRLPEASFNGLNKPDDVHRFECTLVWNQRQRDILALALQQAKEKREEQLGYFLKPTYRVDEEHSYGASGAPYAWHYSMDTQGIIQLDNFHLIAVGKQVVVDVELGASLTLGDELAPNDPVVLITTIPTGLSGGEIHVYYPDEDVRIFPSRVIISGTTATIRIPRSRLVKPELNDDRENHLSYYKNENFLETVDVKYSYTTPVDGVLFAWNNYDCPPSCAQTTQQGCARISGYRADRLSKITVRPGSYTGEVFSAGRFSNCGVPSVVRVSYLSGKQRGMNDEMNTLRLAHTLLPNPPSTCSTVEVVWKDDTMTEGVQTTPYGYTKGALLAWISDIHSRPGAGGMLK